MRIGIDVRMVYYTGAGIGQYIRRLVKGLEQLDLTDEIVLLQSRKQEPTAVEGTPFPWRPLWTPAHHRFEQFALPLELLFLGLDLLHSPDFIPPMRRLCRSVVTVHDLHFLRFPHFLTEEAARYYGQIDDAMKRTDHVIAVSEATRQDLMQLLGVNQNKISVIYEAADPAFRVINDNAALVKVREKYNLPGPFILAVGTIEPRKNWPTLLRIFAQLKDMRVDPDCAGRGAAPDQPLTLVIAGRRGWLDKDVFSVAEDLSLGPRARFLDHVPVEDLVLLYNAAAVLAHPSFYEGFGLPPLEAMACGAPAVVSDTGALPEVVGDAGLKAPPTDVELWIEHLRLVLQDPVRRAGMVQRGLEQATRFSIERMARETFTVYQTVGHPK
ncbi:MAG: glycosyltransferase family 4 protein [Anaerolineae bacterium]|nr:glycosyltransferase family 4 protein [Anaerolineae bacterium]